MDKKEHLLNEIDTQLNDLGFGNLDDLDLIDNILAKEIMAIGTAQDEIYFNIPEVKGMIRRQKEQSAGMNLHYRKKEIYRYYPLGSDYAVVVDMMTVFLTINNDQIEISFRFSKVYELIDERWKLVHFHTSKPENVESETDTFGIDEWKKKAEELEQLIAQRTRELSEKNTELSKTIQELKLTQAQLIQSEKMASLGELTAGIAHEIQNPLNFVTNFSDVNKELISELKAEIKNGNIEEVNAIAGDIEANEEKINHHGKRADAIVKNMLQHSRKSTGQKEPIDINALADEYIRLAYHGMRAKDKSFNVTIETDFDKTIGAINIIPQDIGRVILNLVNNAFYAASQPSEGGLLETDFTKTPTVLVKTRKGDKKVLISIKDNGSGIPANILDKIFQPFFTTKPTGQGTGLGLSLSYDIVKAHGGELKVETKEGEGTTFLIELPFSNKYE
jgi:signal transduction histidine kinase